MTTMIKTGNTINKLKLYEVGDKLEIAYNNQTFIATINYLIPPLIYITNDNNVNNKTVLYFNSDINCWSFPNGSFITSIQLFDNSIKEYEKFPFDQLPIFIQLEILSNTDFATFSKIRKTNKTFHDICDGEEIEHHGNLSHYLYEKRCTIHFDKKYLKYKEELMTWKEFYDRIVELLSKKKKGKWNINLITYLSSKDKLMEIKIVLEENKNENKNENKDHNDRFTLSISFTNAIMSGKLDIIKFFYCNYGLSANKYHVKHCMRRGYLNVVEWFEENGLIYEFDEEDMPHILDQNNPELLDWLLKKEIDIPLYYLSKFEKHIRLPILKWFLERGASIPERIGYIAADYDRVDIFEYLFSQNNSSKYIIYEHLEVATVAGSLKVMKWFYETFKVVPTREAVNYIAHIGFMDVLEYLNSIGYEFDPSIINHTLMSGDFDIIKWLHSLDYDIDSETLKLAIEFDNSTIVEWLYSEGIEYEDEPYIPKSPPIKSELVKHMYYEDSREFENDYELMNNSPIINYLNSKFKFI